MGFYKKGSGKPSITWPESVDEALCVGWIDGVRRSLDDEAYTIRFTPRRKGSIWSAVNIKRARELSAAGLMRPAGLAAFEQARREEIRHLLVRAENDDGVRSGIREEVSRQEEGMGLLRSAAAVVSAANALLRHEREE